MPKQNFTDEDIEKLIEMAETRGQPDPYTAVNKDSGALGRFQLLKTYHKDPVEKKYNIPFEDIVKYPEYQDDYFRSALLPGYKKSTKDILEKNPKSKIDELTLTAMHQLGAGNVRKYLSGKADENINQQMEHFLKIADEYKRQKAMGSYTQSFEKLKEAIKNYNQNRQMASEKE
jgi:hypothetical protein